jgi:hypothetical protein
MRDQLFFSLAAILAGTFVFTALQPFADRPPRGPVSCGNCADKEDVTVRGRELHRFVPGNYDGIAIVRPPEGGEPILRLTRKAEEVYDDPRSGPNIVLAEDLEYAFESRPVEVVIEARSAGDFPASQFEADYFARTESESGWRKFDLTSEFKPYTFTFDVPKRGLTEGYDYVGIRPVTPDKHRVMEVRSVRIHAMGAKVKDAPEASAAPATPLPAPTPH